jgi:hypothetical protein
MADGFGASVRKRLAGTGVWVRSRELVRGRLMVWVRPCGNGLLDWSLASLSRIGAWMPDGLGSFVWNWLAGAGVWLRSRELRRGWLMVSVRPCGNGLLGLEFGFALANWRMDA